MEILPGRATNQFSTAVIIKTKNMSKDLSTDLHDLRTTLNAGAQPRDGILSLCTEQVGFSNLLLGDLISMALDQADELPASEGRDRLSSLLNVIAALHEAQCQAVNNLDARIGDLIESYGGDNAGERADKG